VSFPPFFDRIKVTTVKGANGGLGVGRIFRVPDNSEGKGNQV
jgi:hypothetical protein